MLLTTGSLVLAVLALGIADLGSLVVARAKAQAAAEAAALAAAVRLAPVLGQAGAPEDAARESAEANGARLESCDCEPGGGSATVVVTVPAPVVLVAGWLEREARAEARAEVDTTIYSYRGEA